jgi:hypothetical protein
MESPPASASITLNVKSTDGWCCVRQTDPYELAGSLAAACAEFLPVDRNVALLYNGGILSPYLSFLYQGVHDGDTIVIYPIPLETDRTEVEQNPTVPSDPP